MRVISADGGSSCCEFEELAPAHHDRMVDLESNAFDAMVELIEIAATWYELEYSEGEPVLGPESWIAFAQAHNWVDPCRIMDLMLGLVSLAGPLAPTNYAAPEASVTDITDAPSVRSAS